MIALAYALSVLGLVPLAWLLWRRERRLAWWLVASGLGVSFLADVAGWLGYTQLASQVYPVMQAALIAIALLERPAFVAYVGALVFAASLSIMWRGAGGYDVILRTVSWGGVSLFAGLYLDRSVLRTTLATGFAAMLVAWLWYALEPGMASWGALQLARAGTTVGFCVAARTA